MLLTTEITTKINPRNINWYRSLGYLNKMNTEFVVMVDHVPLQSNVVVFVRCDCCGIDKSIKYQDYNKHTKNKTEDYLCKKCNYTKNAKTCMLKYGVSNPMFVKKFSDKYKQTCLIKYDNEYYIASDKCISERREFLISKYGVENAFQIKELYAKSYKNKRITMEKKKSWITISQKSDFQVYKSIVRRQTRININWDIWDGCDFYDGEYIKHNKSKNCYDDSYPTIDHKISIYEGFQNNISTWVISGVDNLCVTKRIINIKKQTGSYKK